jgi:hypothetical protein
VSQGQWHARTHPDPQNFDLEVPALHVCTGV